MINYEFLIFSRLYINTWQGNLIRAFTGNSEIKFSLLKCFKKALRVARSFKKLLLIEYKGKVSSFFKQIYHLLIFILLTTINKMFLIKSFHCQQKKKFETLNIHKRLEQISKRTTHYRL